jgi:hypothetical protein
MIFIQYLNRNNCILYLFFSSDHCTNPPACENGGFVNFQCTCVCPDGLTGATCTDTVSNSGKFVTPGTMLTIFIYDKTASVAKWLACSPRVWFIVGSRFKVQGRVKLKTITLVFVASPLITQH